MFVIKRLYINSDPHQGMLFADPYQFFSRFCCICLHVPIHFYGIFLSPFVY